jgi:hypothetical protein
MAKFLCAVLVFVAAPLAILRFSLAALVFVAAPLAVIGFSRPLRAFFRRSDHSQPLFTERGAWWARAALVLAASVVASAVLISFEPALYVVMLILVSVALFVRNWYHEFSYLMSLGDASFPGRYDKPIWAALLILLPPVGALTFWFYRRSHFAATKPAVSEFQSELG